MGIILIYNYTLNYSTKTCQIGNGAIIFKIYLSNEGFLRSGLTMAPLRVQGICDAVSDLFTIVWMALVHMCVCVCVSGPKENSPCQG